MNFTTYGDFDARARASFARQPAMALLGAEIEKMAAGEVHLAMPFDARFTQQHGFIHAGFITTVLDTAAGIAAFTLMPEDAGVLTIELKTSLMAPARGEQFRFEGRVLKPGRNVIFTEAVAFAEHGGALREIARLSASMMVVRGRDDVKG